MCRYAFYKYKNTFGCFKCQIGFKRRNLFDVQPNRTEPSEDFNCPNCGGEMTNLGRDLRLPNKNKDEQWRAIKYLVDHKYNIYSCGCQGIGFVPHKVSEAVELVAETARKLRLYLEMEKKKPILEAKAKAKRDQAKIRKTESLLRAIKKDEKL
jgi:hypothetical protein